MIEGEGIVKFLRCLRRKERCVAGNLLLHSLSEKVEFDLLWANRMVWNLDVERGAMGEAFPTVWKICKTTGDYPSG